MLSSKFIRELLTRLFPVTVVVKPTFPEVALEGERLLVVGNGLLTVKVNADVDVPPPGVGFVTVTGIVPAVAISDAAMAAVTCVPAPLAVPA